MTKDVTKWNIISQNNPWFAPEQIGFYLAGIKVKDGRSITTSNIVKLHLDDPDNLVVETRSGSFYRLVGPSVDIPIADKTRLVPLDEVQKHLEVQDTIFKKRNLK